MAKKSKIGSTAEPKRRDAGAAPRRAYPDLHEHLEALKRAGLLITVDRPINKDTEMHPLVRWQFRGGIEEPDRKAFLFTQVTDAKRRKYDIPVAVGALAASREIYRIGMGCALDGINETWNRAMAKPIPPRIVEDASHARSEEHTSELQSLAYLVCRLLLEKKKKKRP